MASFERRVWVVTHFICCKNCSRQHPPTAAALFHYHIRGLTGSYPFQNWKILGVCGRAAAGRHCSNPPYLNGWLLLYSKLISLFTDICKISRLAIFPCQKQLWQYNTDITRISFFYILKNMDVTKSLMLCKCLHFLKVYTLKGLYTDKL